MFLSKPMKSFLPVQVFLCSLLSALPVRADVKMPAIFSEHMVLQRTASVPVWGWADPREEIVVSLGSQKATATADQDGRWTATLNLTELPAGPFEMIVNGKNEIKISDVVIGEVWLASGQSNMEWSLKNTIDAEKEIAASSNPMIRQFLVKKNSPLEPAKDVEGVWTVASPSTSAGFTAVGYYFAKSLNSALCMPVGVINSSWGGTPSEAWTSAKGLSKDPVLAESVKTNRAKLIGAPAELKAYVQAMQEWTQETGRANQPIAEPAPFAGNLENMDGWETVKIPGKITTPGLPEAGIVWVRREVEAKGGEALPLTLPLEGFDQVFWNGDLIAETPMEKNPGKGHIRKGGAYAIPADRVKPGVNVLAIRLHQPSEPAEFKGKPTAGPIDLSGDWKAKAEAVFPPVSAELTAKIPKIPTKAPEARNTASSLFDGMISPLVPYGLRGVIWYQGEANSSRAAQYRTAFPLLIKDWRDQWQNENLPFYFCQLANFMAKTLEPGDSAWAELREAQSMTLSLPATGEAVLIDIGEANDIHPRNKKEVGERLAPHRSCKGLRQTGGLFGTSLQIGHLRQKYGHRSLFACRGRTRCRQTSRNPCAQKPHQRISPPRAKQPTERVGRLCHLRGRQNMALGRCHHGWRNSSRFFPECP